MFCKLVNYFRAVYFNDSDCIIIIYPLADCEYLLCIDLNYLNNIKDNYYLFLNNLTSSNSLKVTNW